MTLDAGDILGDRAAELVAGSDLPQSSAATSPQSAATEGGECTGVERRLIEGAGEMALLDFDVGGERVMAGDDTFLAPLVVVVPLDPPLRIVLLDDVSLVG